jgi:CheY-like chemotaxis protein
MAMSTQMIIVMIEDDEGHARLIERHLRRAGIDDEIVPFTTGAPALEYLLGPDGTGAANHDRPFVLLLDLSLPDMHGAHILQTVKKNRNLQHSPVVVLTTTDDKYEVDRCYSLGCDSYVVKPINYEAFGHAIQSLGELLKAMKPA